MTRLDLDIRADAYELSLGGRVLARLEGGPRALLAGAGVVRLFVLPSDLKAKPAAERAVAAYMSKATGDEKWNEPKAIKTLTLEHRMAASRMGFLEAFSPLYDHDSWSTSFLEGSLPVLRFFSEQVLSLVNAKRANDRFAVARSRAKESLALVAYSSAPERIRSFVLQKGWFSAAEIVIGLPA